MRPGHVLLLSPLLLPAVLSAQDLRARVSMEEPQRHFLHVELTLTGFAEEELQVALPVWTPGSYKVRDYAQFVEGVSATDGGGAPLEVRKTEKSRWVISRGDAAVVRLRFDAFAYEESVRQCYLDDTQAFLTPAAILPYVVGHEELPYVVEVVPPADDWVVDTSLEALGERTFRARDYDELVDSPLQVGTQARYPFEVDGTEFTLVVSGDGNLDGQAMAADMAKVVAAAGELFGGFPFERYLFLLRLGRGGGGLEHRASTALMSGAWGFDSKGGWRGFLGLVAHEFFHAWNVKRIRDEPLGPFDYTREVYTELLWVHEGWTTYYGPLLLRRAGLKTAKELLKDRERTVRSYRERPGRRVQSLAAASRDAWIKRYQTSATTRNSTVDYYGQGAAAALCFDLIVRHHSGGERSLDDVLRSLWSEYASQGRPVNPGIVRAALVRLGGLEADEFWRRHVEGTDEVDFARYLAYAGLELELKRDGDEDAEEEGAPGDEAEGEEAAGGEEASEEASEEGDAEPWDQGVVPHLDWATSGDGRSLVVRGLDRDGVAWRAGFALGDELLAIGDRRVTPSTWPKLLVRHRDAGEVEVLIARRGRLLRLTLPLGERAPKVSLKEMEEPDELQRKVYAGLFDEPLEEPEEPEEENAEGSGQEALPPSGGETDG